MRNRLTLLLFALFSSIALVAQKPLLSESKITPGEKLFYKVSFGFLTVGEATIITKNELTSQQNTPCYHIDITGKTLGAVAWFAKVNDRWGAHLDSATLLPMMGYRNIRENSYRRDETTHFYQTKRKLRYQRHNLKKAKPSDPKLLETKDEVMDLISAYQYLRRLDYDRISQKDTVAIYGFFEDEFYDFNVLYAGIETIKTKYGKIKAHKLVPLMPDNDIFDGENAISIWISADDNRIPLRIKADMLVGSGIVELSDYENTAKPLN